MREGSSGSGRAAGSRGELGAAGRATGSSKRARRRASACSWRKCLPGSATARWASSNEKFVAGMGSFPRYRAMEVCGCGEEGAGRAGARAGRLARPRSTAAMPMAVLDRGAGRARRRRRRTSRDSTLAETGATRFLPDRARARAGRFRTRPRCERRRRACPRAPVGTRRSDARSPLGGPENVTCLSRADPLAVAGRPPGGAIVCCRSNDDAKGGARDGTARCVVARRRPPVAPSRSSLKVKSQPSAREPLDGQSGPNGSGTDRTAQREKYGFRHDEVHNWSVPRVNPSYVRLDRNSAFRYQRIDKAKNPRKAACSRGRRDDASLRLATSKSRRSRNTRHISARASASASSAPTEHRGIRGGSATSGSVWRVVGRERAPCVVKKRSSERRPARETPGERLAGCRRPKRPTASPPRRRTEASPSPSPR